MKRWLMRIAWLGAGAAVLGFLVAASGLVSIRASSGHWPVTEWFLRFSMKRSVAIHSLGTKPPGDLADPQRVQLGAAHYELACRSCHGAPDAPRPRVALHLLPPPPELAPRVRESNPRRLYEVVQHGMKFTGMPAWPAPERDDEAWSVVAFLLEYPKLSGMDYARLAGAAETAPPAIPRSCVGCHGADGLGRGNPRVPRLAGQRAGYLEAALQAYASGGRHGGMMEPAAAELSREAISAIVRHYAAQPVPVRIPAPPADPAALGRGERIARDGIPGERVPACLDCHGPAGPRTKPEYPLLAGQPAPYLEAQLTLFRENRRGGGQHAHVMQPIAARLTPAQARDVAAYFASLAGNGEAR